MRRCRLTALAALTLGALATGVPQALALTASATFTAGSLAFVSAPSAVTFPTTTLNGLDRTLTASQTLDLGDATGSGAGWNVTATSTTFTAGANTLPSAATTIASTPPMPTCDTNSTCAPASAGVGVSYPYTLPAAAVAPAATKMYSAAAASGLGDQTLNLAWSLHVPSKAVVGAYASTWTLSLVSGP